MKENISKYLIISFGIHFLLILFIFIENNEIKKSDTSMLLVEVVSLKANTNINNEKQEEKTNEIEKNKSHIEKKKTIKKNYFKDNPNIIYNNKTLNKEFYIKKNEQDKRITVTKKTINKGTKKKNSKAIYKVGSINNPHPPYPLIARKKGWQGNLTVNVLVNKNGLVDKINIKKSSGHKLLDEISIKTIKKWYFIPARSGTTNIKDQLIIPVRFILSE
ncbi:energy transducer TonB [Rickettsiales bacterium]|nr:energy transducer TonB [Rickettsiales bacterium]